MIHIKQYVLCPNCSSKNTFYLLGSLYCSDCHFIQTPDDKKNKRYNFEKLEDFHDNKI